MVGRGLQFLNLNQVKTQADNPLEQVMRAALDGAGERACPRYLLPLLIALEGTAQSTLPRLGG